VQGNDSVSSRHRKAKDHRRRGGAEVREGLPLGAGDSVDGNHLAHLCSLKGKRSQEAQSSAKGFLWGRVIRCTGMTWRIFVARCL
jgi:hypothetical protein